MRPTRSKRRAAARSALRYSLPAHSSSWNSRTLARDSRSRNACSSRSTPPNPWGREPVSASAPVTASSRRLKENTPAGIASRAAPFSLFFCPVLRNRSRKTARLRTPCLRKASCEVPSPSEGLFFHRHGCIRCAFGGCRVCRALFPPHCLRRHHALRARASGLARCPGELPRFTGHPFSLLETVRRRVSTYLALAVLLVLLRFGQIPFHAKSSPGRLAFPSCACFFSLCVCASSELRLRRA